MDAYLRDLIARMTDKDILPVAHKVPYSSAGSVSFKAYREADALQNKAYLPVLIDYVQSEKEKKTAVPPTLFWASCWQNSRSRKSFSFIFINCSASTTSTYCILC